MCSFIQYILRVILVASFIVISKFTFCQVLKPLRQTTGISGQSNELIIGNRKYIAQQSIGQGSVIGTFTNGTHTLRQGFIQPSHQRKSITRKDELSRLNATVFPNPFSNRIVVEISEDIKDPVVVSIHDVTGRVITIKEFSASRTLEFDTGAMHPGLYIVRVSSQSKFFSAKLVKK